MASRRAHPDPRTKEEFLSRLLAQDFSGNIRELGTEVRLSRAAPNVVRVSFPATSTLYELVVRKPRQVAA